MAKKSVKNRNKRRTKLLTRMRSVRNKLRDEMGNIHLSEKERETAAIKLQKLPRDSSPSRHRNRCNLCGRPRAYNRLTGLCRLHMRIATVAGMIPGLRKASW